MRLGFWRAKEPGEAPSGFDRRNAWKWTTLMPALAILAVFVITIFDPFDFESVSKRQSARIMYKLFAPVYPTTNRDKIAVVLLDDATLKDRPDEAWPPSHLVHGDVLDAILSYKPAAVLVDIFFLQPSGDDHFARTKCVIEANAFLPGRNPAARDDCGVDPHAENPAKVPLMFVAANAMPYLPPARRELLGMARDHLVELVSADIEGEPSVAPLYPLHRDAQDREPAALALYHWICHDPAHARLPGVACADIEGHGERMEPVWGLHPADINCRRAAMSDDRAIKHACEDLLGSVPGRAIQLAWEVVIPSERRLTDPFPIMFHPTVSARNLLRNPDPQQLGPLLAGKIVFYGAQLSLVKDLVYSPVHGQIDGINMHAMALDNLLTYGDRYVHQAEGHGTFRKEWTEFQPAALMLIAGLATMWNRRRLLATGQHKSEESLLAADEHFLLWARRILVGVIVAAGLVEFFVWSISPFNWIALLIVVHLAHWMERKFFKIGEIEVEEPGAAKPHG
jgi:CHASE2 domain